MAEQLILKNPHSILEVLHHRPQAVMDLTLPSKKNDYWAEVENQARANKIHYKGGEPSAKIKPKPPVSKEALFEHPEEGFGLWLALDSLQDPQNVGAIFRSAAFFGVRGILLTQDRSTSLTGTVYDVASGGLEHVPYAVETNLAQTLTYAKDNGVWRTGLFSWRTK
jgi:23S rRNA (guanosine2251-2'-O)-methyltransferase